MNSKRNWMGQLLALTVGLTGLVGTGAQAQSDYPSKPVKIIVAFPPGGTSDVMARMVADEMGKLLKQPFLVENIGGAGLSNCLPTAIP